MRNARNWIVAAFGFLLLFNGCMSEEIYRTRQMIINNIDISKIPDGIYHGDFSYGKTTYKVKVLIEKSKYKEIEVLANGATKQAKMAEGVVEKIIQEQRNDVDVVSGATTTSKALLKAIENALCDQKTK